MYRQRALADCAAHPQFAKDLYSLATDALEGHKKVTFWSLNVTPESLRYYSVQSLELLLGHLLRLRRLAEAHGQELASPAFTRLCSMLLSELGDEYLRALGSHLSELKLARGLVMSARLSPASRGAAYVLHRAPARGLRGRLSRRGQASYSFTIPERDDNGARALGELHARGVNIAANALAQSVDHILGFFTSLRAELAFLHRVPQPANGRGGQGGTGLHPGPVAR